MPLATLIFLALLPQAATQSPPSRAIIQSNGHTFQLFCTAKGELIAASETGVCEKGDSGGIEHFEIRNEDGEARFSQDAPEGNAFTYVGIFAVTGGPREILDVETSHDQNPGGDRKAARLSYYFDMAPSGLVRFEPALSGVDGFAHLNNGVALSRTFDAGFFQFSVLLEFNFVSHRIAILPDQSVFSALPPSGREKAQASGAAGLLKLHSAHDNASTATDTRILPGHKVTWWQSLSVNDSPGPAQNVKVLAAWAPASLKPADSAPEGVQMVYYDWNNLWLQVQVDEHTGWIRGTGNFRLIGLEMGTGSR